MILLARCVDEFLELPEKKMAGASFYMFWLRFIPEMLSALSAAFLCGRAFVCLSARLAVHDFAVYWILGS